MKIVVSSLKSPFINLAIEHWLFKNTPLNHWPILYLYTNDPCVVIGRNQNPWREVNVPLVNSLGIPVVRRRSGGGTVVHDAGNVNFCIMTTKDEFNRETYAKMITDAVNSKRLGQELRVNERYDIVLRSNGNKVSGSAYKIERDRAYHHGTMLLSSKLDVLRALLHRDISRLGSIEGRGVTSVKSPVANVGCDSQEFIDTVIEAFRAKHGGEDMLHIDKFMSEKRLTDAIKFDAGVLQSWDWVYGLTPLFTHTLSDPLESTDQKFVFEVEKGRIVSHLGNGLLYKGQELADSRMFPAWIPQAIDGYDSITIKSSFV